MELFAEIFHQKGFEEVKTNLSNILIFISDQPEKKYMVILFHMPNGVEWNRELCTNVERQLIEKLWTDSSKELQLITFLCTNRVDLVRDIYRQNDHTAVIDLENKQLFIFEGMSQDELGIYKDIEKALQPEPKRKKDQIIRGLQTIGYANAVFISLNILIFVILILTNTYDVAVENGKLYWMAVNEYHEYYRIFTCMFLHGGVGHLFNNMLILGYIGGILEKQIGWIRFSVLYLVSGIAAGIVSLIMNMEDVSTGSIGASGAIFGVVGAVLWIVLINKGKVEKLSKRQMLLFVFFSLYGGFSNQGIDNAAHIGGLIGGFLLAILIYRKPKRRGGVS